MEWIHLYNFKEVLFSSAEVNFGRYQNCSIVTNISKFLLNIIVKVRSMDSWIDILKIQQILHYSEPLT